MNQELTTNKQKGNFGEEVSVAFLKKKGYEIRHTKWQFSHKEIDIVAADGNMLVIVEVKTRKSDFFQNPEDAVSRSKIRFLLDAAEAYVDIFNLNMDIRFDVITIILKESGGYDLEHFEDAFLPPLM